MRFLIVVPRILYPLDTGAKIRSAKLFEELAKKHETTIVCLSSPDDRVQDVERMRSICGRLETIEWNEVATHTTRFYFELFRGLLSLKPYSVNKFTVTALRHQVEALLDEGEYDVVMCDTLPLASNVPDNIGVPAVLFQHNAESVIRRRQFEKARNPLKRAYLYWDWLRTHRYERLAGRRFDHCIMVSDNDCETMRREYGVTTTSAIPLGVDVEYFRPYESGLVENSRDIVFTGCMDWMPNIDGVKFFVEDVLPLIETRVPCRLWVVGRRPTSEVRSLGEANVSVEVTGGVDDIRPYMACGAVYVVPLRIGGGTRIKIFEAFAMGKAVVSTTVGAEGLPVMHGENILLADSAEAFAGSVVQLLANRKYRRRLGDAARRLVETRFTWQNAAMEMACICERVACSREGGDG